MVSPTSAHITHITLLLYWDLCFQILCPIGPARLWTSVNRNCALILFWGFHSAYCGASVANMEISIPCLWGNLLSCEKIGFGVQILHVPPLERHLLSLSLRPLLSLAMVFTVLRLTRVLWVIFGPEDSHLLHAKSQWDTLKHDPALKHSGTEAIVEKALQRWLIYFTHTDVQEQGGTERTLRFFSEDVNSIWSTIDCSLKEWGSVFFYSMISFSVSFPVNASSDPKKHCDDHNVPHTSQMHHEGYYHFGWKLLNTLQRMLWVLAFHRPLKNWEDFQ